jgi:hypothetical protein
MLHIKKFSLSKIVSAFTMLALLSAMVVPGLAMAASVTSFKDVLSREAASTLADHTITFTTPTGIAAAATLILTFDNSTSIDAALDFTDIDLADDGVDVTLAAAPSGATWGVVRTSSTVITFTNGSGAVAAGSVVTIEIGTNATTGATGDKQITNGPAGTTTLVLSGTFGDTGTTSMSIDDGDQVTVSANVNETISFDLDTASDFTNGESVAPYAVALGTLTTGAVNVSNTSSIRMIVAEGATNASGGMNVTVQNANGASGLKSTSTPADVIGSTTGTMSAGTTNYGLCVATSGLTGFTRAAGTYGADTCALSSSTNGIRGLTTTPANILTSSGVLASGHAEIPVQATIDGAVPAHADYSDTLTFIATATF